MPPNITTTKGFFGLKFRGIGKTPSGKRGIGEAERAKSLLAGGDQRDECADGGRLEHLARVGL